MRQKEGRPSISPFFWTSKSGSFNGHQPNRNLKGGNQAEKGQLLQGGSCTFGFRKGPLELAAWIASCSWHSVLLKTIGLCCAVALLHHGMRGADGSIPTAAPRLVALSRCYAGRGIMGSCHVAGGKIAHKQPINSLLVSTNQQVTRFCLHIPRSAHSRNWCALCIRCVRGPFPESWSLVAADVQFSRFWDVHRLRSWVATTTRST